MDAPSPRTHPALIVAAVAVAGAALLGIAAMMGWLPRGPSVPTPASLPSPGQGIAGTAPADSLSPGESVVSAPEGAGPPKQPQSTSPAASPPSASKPAKPAYAAKPSSPRSTCDNCGTVASIATRSVDTRSRGRWEVRVRFDDGSTRVFRFPTDPGFATGDTVRYQDGRLARN